MSVDLAWRIFDLWHKLPPEVERMPLFEAMFSAIAVAWGYEEFLAGRLPCPVEYQLVGGESA